MRASHALRWLAGGILVLWCGVFLRMETTEKSMVRALIVQPNRSGWAVQLLYQFPEAAADASDAVAEMPRCRSRCTKPNGNCPKLQITGCVNIFSLTKQRHKLTFWNWKSFCKRNPSAACRRGYSLLLASRH